LIPHLTVDGKPTHSLDIGMPSFEFLDALELGDTHATVISLPSVIGRLVMERSGMFRRAGH